MPSWKKVITSGSAAALSSLNVTGGITGSSIIITGSAGTLFSSNVDTLILTGSMIVTGSSVITGSLNVTQGITGSLFGTASWAISASWAPTPALATTASYALTSSNIQGGATNYIPLWNTATSLSSSVLYQSSGNVGIETTSPSEKLSVGGNINLLLGSGGTKIGFNVGTGFTAYGTSKAHYGLTYSNDTNPVILSGYDGVSLFTRGAERLTVSSSGNVGIGTTSPTSKLQSNNASTYNSTTPSGAIIASNLSNGNAVVDIGVDSALLGYIQSRNITSTTSYNLLLNPIGGNVGIGTTSPNAKLDVNGNTIITGSLAVSQSLLQYSNNAAIISGSTANIASFPTSSYMAGFFDFVASSNGNARAGTVFTVWNGASLEFTETSTNDIGTTTNLILSASLSGTNVLLQGTSLSGSWNVKTLTRMI